MCYYDRVCAAIPRINEIDRLLENNLVSEDEMWDLCEEKAWLKADYESEHVEVENEIAEEIMRSMR